MYSTIVWVLTCTLMFMAAIFLVVGPLHAGRDAFLDQRLRLDGLVLWGTDGRANRHTVLHLERQYRYRWLVVGHGGTVTLSLRRPAGDRLRRRPPRAALAELDDDFVASSESTTVTSSRCQQSSGGDDDDDDVSSSTTQPSRQRLVADRQLQAALRLDRSDEALALAATGTLYTFQPNYRLPSHFYASTQPGVYVDVYLTH